MFTDTSNKIEAIANATIESGSQVAFLAQENEVLRAQVSSMQDILVAMQTAISNQHSNAQHNPPPPPHNVGRGRGRGRGRNRPRQPRGLMPIANTIVIVML